MSEKIQLAEKIRNYLLEVDNPKSVIAVTIKAAAKHRFNFEMLVGLIMDYYRESPKDITKTIGEVPMRLIIQYTKL